MRIKPSDNLRELSLLYVEDDAPIREALSEILKRYVRTLYIAKDGKEGLRLFETHHPEIVVSDIRMPRIDGVEMVRRIKEMKRETAVIFTTAFGEPHYLKEAIDLGVEGYLIKPVDRHKLMEKLNFIADAIVNERRRNAYQRLLNSLFDAQKEAIALIEKSGQIVLSNLSYKKLCLEIGCRETTRFEEIARFFIESDRCRTPLIENREKLVEWLIDADGATVCLKTGKNLRYFDIHVRPVEDLLFLELHDVSRFKVESIKLERENVIDALTSVYNRKIVPRLVHEMLGNDKKYCFVLADIDHFKRINDTFGHSVGDEVLKEIAKVMKENLRKGDSVIRWGGEEFLIVMETEGEDGMKTAEKLRRMVETIAFPGVGSVTISMGISCGKIFHESDFHQWIVEADKALYRAKALGRNRVEGADRHG